MSYEPHKHLWWRTSPRAISDPWAWGVCVVLLLLLAAVATTHGDVAIFLRINSWSSITGEWVWPNLTILGDSVVALVAITPVVQRRPELFWRVTLAALCATVWVHALKYALALPRPPAVLGTDHIHIQGPGHRNFSFPSGHTTTAFVMAGLLALHLRHTALIAALIACATLIGLSRAVVGVHWPTDILAGALGGWLSAILGTWIAQRYAWSRRAASYRTIALLFTSAALALLFFHDTEYPQARTLQIIIATGALGSLALPLLRRK